MRSLGQKEKKHQNDLSKFKCSTVWRSQKKNIPKAGAPGPCLCTRGRTSTGHGLLVRRLLENTSNDGFLKLSYHDNVDTGALLKSPEPIKEETALIEKPESLDAPFFNCLMPTSHSVLEEAFKRH